MGNLKNTMKKIMLMIPFVIMLIVLGASVWFCVYSIVAVNRALHEIANDPSASGIDYWGIGWGYGIGLFMRSIFGLILAIIDGIILKQAILRRISFASIILFVILIMVSIGIFYL